MWTSRFFWNVFAAYAVLGLIATGCLAAIVSRWHRTLALEQVEGRLYETAVVLRSCVAERSELRATEGYQSLVAGLANKSAARATLVAADGVVLADSFEDPARMENQKDIPEIVQAQRQGIGWSERASVLRPDSFAIRTAAERGPDGAGNPPASQTQEMLHLAVRCDGGSAVRFVRVALETSFIRGQARKLQGLIWSVGAALALTMFAVTHVLVGRIIRPLATLTLAADAITRGELRPRVFVPSRNELGVFASAFDRMSDELAQRIRQLTRNGEQLSAVLGSMDEGVVAVDRFQRIMLANESAGRLLAFAPTECAGRPLLELVRNPQVHEVVVNTLNGEEGGRAEVETTGGTRRTLALRATRLPGEPSRGVVLVLDDISELRRLENLRREFVANVSHELKTPLASIKAYAETLKLGAINDPEHNAQFVEQIEKQSDRLHQLIIDLLQITRIESEQEVFDITSVCIAEVVANCVSAHEQAASAKEIGLEVQPSEAAALARADEEGLRTILDNLVDNAIKYTPAGGRVIIRWQPDEAEVVIEVEDTGIGIGESHRSRIFERFYRVDRARSRQLGGTGLGLSIVKHLAQAFGGSVAVSSEIGEGSTFSVRLSRP